MSKNAFCLVRKKKNNSKLGGLPNLPKNRRKKWIASCAPSPTQASATPGGLRKWRTKIPASVIGDFLFGMILYFIFVRRLIKHRRDRYFR